ncbi:hypothetical protein DERP_012295 [Dermatophagoides pteronyssinus]|uniref:Uncharacterized protein n=1 Tax=Dermatophagoides pteronyssinus TaxID=6956 RepID=A0ABQ8JQC1_DERPT|nr:hypothetical protein DERP_012295 [Dermatophagoides pteronyssinus]
MSNDNQYIEIDLVILLRWKQNYLSSSFFSHRFEASGVLHSTIIQVNKILFLVILMQCRKNRD